MCNHLTCFDINDMNLVIIIAFKEAIRDFLQYPHCAANFLQHVRSVARAQSCRNHVQHVVIGATWYERTAQLKFDS